MDIKENTLVIRGIVAAGFPTSAEEELVDTMTLDEYLIENREATYMLTVRTDSMRESGILAGDTVIVERGRTPHANDIVIVEQEGSYSLSHFSDVTSTARIEAVVTAVVRKYGKR